MINTRRFPKKPFVYTFAQQRPSIHPRLVCVTQDDTCSNSACCLLYAFVDQSVFGTLLCAFRLASTSNVVQSNEFVTIIKAQTLRCQTHLTPSSPLPSPKISKFKMELRAHCSPLSGCRCDRPKYTLTCYVCMFHSILICSNGKPTTFVAPLQHSSALNCCDTL